MYSIEAFLLSARVIHFLSIPTAFHTEQNANKKGIEDVEACLPEE
jgi:hypothetical protein